MTFKLDYELYQFDFDQFMKVLVENDFGAVEARIDTLVKVTTSQDELIKYLIWSKSDMSQPTVYLQQDQSSFEISRLRNRNKFKLVHNSRSNQKITVICNQIKFQYDMCV